MSVVRVALALSAERARESYYSGCWSLMRAIPESSPAVATRIPLLWRKATGDVIKNGPASESGWQVLASSVNMTLILFKIRHFSLVGYIENE